MVFTGVLLASVPWPPTSRSFGCPAPLAPWQAWHFCSYTSAPAAAVPLPGGRPAPSGPTLMSQPATCAGVASRPRFGPSGVAAVTPAPAQPPTISASATRARSRVDMLHLAARRHAPGLDAVEVEDRVVAVLGDELLAFRLHGAGVVSGARLEHGRRAVPPPGQPEARERARQHRRDQRRLDPGPTCIGRDLDLLDRAVARPGDAGDLMQPTSRQGHAVRGPGDDGFHLHRIGEHQRLAVPLKI